MGGRVRVGLEAVSQLSKGQREGRGASEDKGVPGRTGGPWGWGKGCRRGGQKASEGRSCGTCSFH